MDDKGPMGVKEESLGMTSQVMQKRFQINLIDTANAVKEFIFHVRRPKSKTTHETTQFVPVTQKGKQEATLAHAYRRDARRGTQRAPL